jgi:hypothetical protein
MNTYQKLKEQFKKENSIIRTVKNKDNPYVMINKQGVQDPNLSWAAKGLLAYLLSLPDNWTIYAKELLKHTSSGETNTYTVIRELLRHGYMEKIEYRYKGKILALNYTVFEVPVDVTKTDTSKPRIVKVNDDGEYDETVENTTNEPYWENPNAVKPHEVFTELLINDFNNKDFNNKDFDVDDAEKIIQLYKDMKIEKRAMPHTMKLIRENAPRFSEDVWTYIFIQASEDSVAKKFNYIKTLVNDFIKAGISSQEDLDRYNAKYKESKTTKPKQKDYAPKTRFHNINNRTQNYTPDQLEKLLTDNQKDKFNREQSKDQATPESPLDFVVTREIYDAILMDPSKYTLDQKRKARDFGIANNLFLPRVLTNLEN